MELERYRALVCAVETGSLTAAAERLRYTPSGVSRMVAALEEENGFPLLLRQRSGVRPTADCLRLLPLIREMLRCGENCAQLSAQIRGLDVGTVTVGTAYSAYYSRLAEATSDFHVRYPGIQIQLRSGYSAGLVELLEERLRPQWNERGVYSETDFLRAALEFRSLSCCGPAADAPA